MTTDPMDIVKEALLHAKTDLGACITIQEAKLPGTKAHGLRGTLERVGRGRKQTEQKKSATASAPSPPNSEVQMPDIDAKNDEYNPCVVLFDEPPRAEFVMRDCATIYRDTAHPAVQEILDMETREVIGMCVALPAARLRARRSRNVDRHGRLWRHVSHLSVAPADGGADRGKRRTHSRRALADGAEQMTKRNIEEQVVFGIAPTTDGKPPVITLGIPEGAWKYMQDGKTHTFDLTKVGLPVRIMMFGAKDHSAVMKEIEGSMKAAGVPILDERNKDFSI